MSETPELILSNAGLPFTDKRAASAALGNKGLNPNEHEVIAHDGGFAIRKIQRAPAMRPEKFFKVKFHDKSDPTQPEFVKLIVNGETLTVRRNKEVVIPERFVECARNAKYPHFTHNPGDGRKTSGTIMQFPFDLLGEGTKDEYLAMRKAGTNEMRKLVKDMESPEED